MGFLNHQQLSLPSWKKPMAPGIAWLQMPLGHLVLRVAAREQTLEWHDYVWNTRQRVVGKQQKTKCWSQTDRIHGTGIFTYPKYPDPSKVPILRTRTLAIQVQTLPFKGPRILRVLIYHTKSTIHVGKFKYTIHGYHGTWMNSTIIHCIITWICLLDAWKKNKKTLSQMVVYHGTK